VVMAVRRRVARHLGAEEGDVGKSVGEEALDVTGLIDENIRKASDIVSSLKIGEVVDEIRKSVKEMVERYGRR